jgi:sugar (pentulose or hexulose) kinase
MNNRLSELGRELIPKMPSGTITYPLPMPGERFPFVDPGFKPFTTAGNDPQEIYLSCLEGIACIERWGYEVAADLGADCSGDVWTTGGGAYVDAWMQIRSDILGRPVCRTAFPESAFGSALVAAMAVWYDGSWETAIGELGGEARRWEPRATCRTAYEDHYARFRETCQRRQNQVS